jgi:hypothetical protein
MACICQTCLHHLPVLGIADPPKSKAAIHKAYRAAAKLWHPDRYENNQRKRLEAEEHFKLIQVAYRELCEHFDSPQRRLAAREYGSYGTYDIYGGRAPHGSPPTIFFGDAHHCFSVAHFPESVEKVIFDAALGGAETAVGFVNLSGTILQKEIPSRYVLLTNHRLFIRDASKLVHVLWYADLGDIEYLDSKTSSKQRAWQRIVGWLSDQQQRCTLRIQRRNGTEFYSLTDRPDDRIKKVIYNFLQQMRFESQS